MTEQPANANSDSQEQNSRCCSTAHKILVIGVGSSHGDDQLGWLVAKNLIRRPMLNCQVRIAVTPLELLDWIDECTVIHVVDACEGLGQPGKIHRWNWPCPEIQASRWSGTHDFDLPAVLALAEQLDQLPQQVVVWGVQCTIDHVADSEATVLWVQSVANRIQSEVNAMQVV